MTQVCNIFPSVKRRLKSTASLVKQKDNNKK